MKKTNLTDRIAEEIISYILENHLTEGDRLPNEKTLATQLQVGRSSLREAMKVLESRNIVVIRQGSGMYVADEPGLMQDPLGLAFVRNKIKLREDLMAVRFMVEPHIAALAARNATKSDIKKIFALKDEVAALIRSGDEYRGKDEAFHTAIAMSSKNVVVPRLVPIIHSTIDMFIRVTKRASDPETITAHQEIAEAIAARDPLAAQEAMYAHLLESKKLVISAHKRLGAD
ncbi:MAG: HTH-type transcriptional regulator LutR [Desulfovibrio sp.]